MGHKKVERIDPLSRALPLGGVDSHAHLDDPDFDPDREDVLARARAAGLANVGNVFLGPDDFVARRALFDKHPEVFFLLGIHPCDGRNCTPESLAAMRAAFEIFEPDAVMHLAAESHVDRSIDSPAAFLETNVHGTFVLLEEARRYWKSLTASGSPKARDFRSHHISTDEVFGSERRPGLFH